MKIVVVDYGMGNVKSVISAIRYLGFEDVILSNDSSILASADKLILPGVGNYAMAVKKIHELDLHSIIRELVLCKKIPILGICLGMQLIGRSSTEDGFHEGLALIDAKVEAFNSKGIKIPHVGYNQVEPVLNSRLYSGINTELDYYFTHSFRMQSEADICASRCVYGENFIASFEKNHIAGVQFHPELSQHNGLKLIRNFIEKF
ncbi:imidazole glycerol phosphate synthase subunit HisH [Motilimonas sp. E26]|uniref:imidazole glycerol phosphate synthase subunit HisH n=1 Tax=Motilimonas sp. E26 TaxID=2865674 RepID=UPI001E4B0A4C|nr:imidazole glycerol phosphate synthase subunit HisH [Motilimonas sp. E26]MCE0558568.1 imidazole glycerol phosphate synthase subunit HisH [Motilimonas sp. E26]